MHRSTGLLSALLAASLPIASAVDTLDTASITLTAGRRNFNPAQPAAGLHLRLERVASGLTQPIYLTAPTSGPFLVVVERTGRARIIENGDLRPEPFVDLSAKIDWAGERGFLGLAFAPDYARSGRFYVAFSEKETFATVIMRFHANVGKALADPLSGQEILRIGQSPGRIDHKAGWIGFRPGEPDNLYIAAGDGGGHNDPDNVAQNLLERRGKILRVNVSGDSAGFTVPKDNPFIGRNDALPEIWAYGVRNPYRASFDRQTADLYFGDVGQDAHEELNMEPAGTRGGRNYGWRLMEGRARNRIDPNSQTTNLSAPLLVYDHEEMMFLRGCVIGGYVYRGEAIPELQGKYFFADFTNARIYSLRCAADEASELTDWTALLNPRDSTLPYSGLVSLGEDSAGELYVVDFAGSVLKVVR